MITEKSKELKRHESSLLASLHELSVEELQHLSLHTDSFINALRRFFSRRGLVRLWFI